MSQRISFGPGVTWAAVSALALDGFARDPDATPLATRVLLIALSRVDADGHAHLAPGELSEVLSTVDRATGELRPAPRSNTHHAIRQAASIGYVRRESTPLCLLVTTHVAQAKRGGTRCPEESRRHGDAMAA